MKINLKEHISPNFKELFNDIMKHKYTHYMLKGGRGSTKSTFITNIIPLLIIKNADTHAVIVRKNWSSLKTSVYNQLIWSITDLGIKDFFEIYKSPLKIVYKPTGQEIIFWGCDDPTKSKGITVPFGRIGIVFYEEIDQFNGMEEIRTMTQSFIRKDGDNWIFYAFNPPISKNNWANEECLIERDDRIVFHSDYRSVPKKWLGEQFIIEAEYLKKIKSKAYEHEYLGIATGTGGDIFNNVVSRTITDEEIKVMDNFYYGNDFGFAVDPNSFCKLYYHNNKLYVVDEIYKIGLSNKMLYDNIREKGVKNEIITCDSAEPRTINELRGLGLNVIGARKGPDSIEHGIKWLQSLEEIIIDKNRTPNAYNEFVGYEYDRNKEGQFISRYPDRNNHFIDSVRYALESLINSSKWGW